MKKIFLPFILLFPLFLCAQRITVSEPLIIRNDKAYFLLGNLKDRFLILRDRQKNFEVQAFDERLQLSWKKELELDKKRPEILDAIPVKESFMILYTFRDKNKFILKAQKYDPGANLIDSLIVKNYGSTFITPSFELVYSDDKSKVLIYYFERQTHLHLLSFDLKNMEVLWEQRMELEEGGGTKSFQQIILSNKGDVFLMLDKNNRKMKREEHHFEITSFTGTSIRKNTISMQNKLTYDVLFTYDNLNSRIVAGGLYSDKNRGQTNGYFMLNVKPENSDDNLLSFHQFESKFIADVLKKEKPKEKTIEDSDIQEIVLRRDGGILLVAERNREYERRISSTGRGYLNQDGGRAIVDYYYEDIFVLSIHPNGQLHWNTILHKKQTSQDDGAAFSSYFLLKTPSALRFLFNDDIRFDSSVSEYVIKGNGVFDRNSVMSTEGQNIQLRFQEGMQIASNEMIIPSERRHRLRLVRVTY